MTLESNPAPANADEVRASANFATGTDHSNTAAVPAHLTRPPWSQARTLEERSRNAVVVTLVIVVSLLVLVMMAIPVGRRSRADIESQRLTTELSLTLVELRATIADFHASHGNFPGAGPSRVSDAFWIEHQLDLAFRRAAESSSNSIGTRMGSATFGAPTLDNGAADDGHRLPRTFHIDDPVLENPINQRSNVRFLSATEPWPLEGDDSSGWLYRPATGEIRANSPGKSPWTGTRFLDM